MKVFPRSGGTSVLESVSEQEPGSVCSNNYELVGRYAFVRNEWRVEGGREQMALGKTLFEARGAAFSGFTTEKTKFPSQSPVENAGFKERRFQEINFRPKAALALVELQYRQELESSVSEQCCKKASTSG